MAKEIGYSSYECDCGHRSHFGISTIRELKAESMKKVVHLYDSEPEEHTIIFHKGRMVDIRCPKKQRNSGIKRTARKRAKRSD